MKKNEDSREDKQASPEEVEDTEEIEVTDDVMKGEILSCPSCGLELEVTENKGDCVELKELGIEGEDWGE